MLITRDTVEVDTPASLATVLIDIDTDYNNTKRDFHELPPYIAAMFETQDIPPRDFHENKCLVFRHIPLVLIQITQG